MDRGELSALISPEVERVVVSRLTSTRSGISCPRCASDLLVAPYDDVSLDACPRQCGVWLDRSEFAMVNKRFMRGRGGRGATTEALRVLAPPPPPVAVPGVSPREGPPPARPTPSATTEDVRDRSAASPSLPDPTGSAAPGLRSIRVRDGSDILMALEEEAASGGIASAVVLAGGGSLVDIQLIVGGAGGGREYRITGPCQIVSLTGRLSAAGRGGSNLAVALADITGAVRGGRLRGLLSGSVLWLQGGRRIPGGGS